MSVVTASGATYKNIEEFWAKHKTAAWLDATEKYYSNQDATVAGMLGGLEDSVRDDIPRSLKFIQRLHTKGIIPSLPVPRGLDCGAGVGRVTKALMLKVAKEVHMLEPCQRFLDSSIELVGSDAVTQRYCATFTSFDPPKDACYDIIWIQWAIGYITDAEMHGVLTKLRASLSETGVLIIKDNTTSNSSYFLDDDDNFLIRPAIAVKRHATNAGFKLADHAVETRPGLYPVHVWAFVAEG
ncbi:Protein of unknown function DUF858 methyltransferase-like [Carpediemonas membranifera]|uniref:Alpha N-terminal protein methyltransferase 1 n=1 Tax=Carpediemonas membranifera TaxID=201153 RepID=A0A8J6AR63_9EUKA|nr:Protein of unknown function DUF858 methyltransferase-like [Carpediemonas membranifera]|eukprot:KAG9392206.1 Protein of unknown function DUF858 methyltransferase-like [Carpediemonas membranifera]